MQSSSMVIGTRGQNLRRIERKTGVKKMTVVPSSIKVRWMLCNVCIIDIHMYLCVHLCSHVYT